MRPAADAAGRDRSGVRGAERLSVPDRQLLTRARQALDMWEASGSGPTSSISGSGAVTALERRVAARCGTRFALALPSGTLALRVALQSVGVKAGANVVVPALDWPAAAGAVLSLSAVPRPADVCAGSLLVDPDAVADRIDCTTRAVVVTHVAGMMADVSRLADVCQRRGVALIEDACQAFGATRAGRPAGSVSDAGVISLGPGKLIDAGEAGVLVTNSSALHRAAITVSQHPVRQLRSGLVPERFGLSARVHPLAAILAWAALERIDAELQHRRAAAHVISERAAALGCIAIPRERPDERFAWPCVPGLLAATPQQSLAAPGIDAVPLGIENIARLLDDPTPTPHADAMHRRAVRLFLTGTLPSPRPSL